MAVEEYEQDGVWVIHARPEEETPGWPPLVFVHGGQHASWSFDHLLPFFADRGWECLAFDWFNHGRSRKTDAETFLKRGIGDVTTEIAIVSSLADGPPLLVGHSMGAAASMAYAASNAVAGLVLLTPVLPAGIGEAADSEAGEFPIDMDQLVPPLPLARARELFFTSLDEVSARRYTRLLTAESPVAVRQAAESSLEVDLDAFDVPSLVIAGGKDRMCPPAAQEKLATVLGSEYFVLESAGHDDILLHHAAWQVVAARIHDWLADTI
ncbi:alpha/beta fold hydrolase [Amycolatopsis sp. cg5]|uniref:alpha/beta fold hydrolase n=1 Tax=Amycolatopsis sp. cg5 TaxID=3238802 RepID=UPI00352658E5